jgi:hypothetical protein
LILGVVECIHRPFACRQIFQLPQPVALALAGQLAGGKGHNDSVFGLAFALLEGGKPGRCLPLECLALLAQEERPHALLLPFLKVLGTRPFQPLLGALVPPVPSVGL